MWVLDPGTNKIVLKTITYVRTAKWLRCCVLVFEMDVGQEMRHQLLTNAVGRFVQVPGLYKIFDEIIVNAADNKQRDKSMSALKVVIDPASNTLSVWNNG